MAETAKLNIPRRLLEQAVKNKDMESLLYLSVNIKGRYRDSRLRNVSMKKIRSITGFSAKKAKAVLELAKGNDMFEYNEYTNCLTAKNLKKKYIMRYYTKGGRMVPGLKLVEYGFLCSSYRDFHRWIQEALVSDTLISDVRKHNRLERDKSKKTIGTFTTLSKREKASLSTYRSVCTYEQMSERTGMSRKQMITTIGRMEGNGELIVYRRKAFEADQDDKRVRQFKGSRSLAEYIQPANAYNLTKLVDFCRYSFVLLDNEWRGGHCKSFRASSMCHAERTEKRRKKTFSKREEERCKNYAAKGYASRF